MGSKTIVLSLFSACWVELCRLRDSALFATLVSLALVAFLGNGLRSWYRLSHVPGPFWAGISKYWIVKQSLKGRQPYAFHEVVNQYGPLARVGPNELATGDSEVLRRMMAVRSPYSRGPWYNALRFEPGKDNLFSMRDEDAHTKLRQKMAPGYSGKENESLEKTIDDHIRRLVNLFENKYLSTRDDYRPTDFARKIQYFTLDVISDLAFGQPFGFVEQDTDVFDFIKITRDFFPVATLMAHVPWVVALFHSPLFRGLLPKATDKVGFGAFIGVANQKVAERFEPNAASHPDMLGSFIRHGLTQEQAQRESLLNVVAGSDTTATTIRVMMLSLLTNPLAYGRLQEEISDGIAEGRISSPVTDAEARQLPYLQATIKEGLRMKAPAAGPLYKTVPPEGDIIDGKFIPGGTHIGTSPFSIYQSKETFGEDASLFSPQRWIDADAESYAKMSSVVDLVFSVGKYQCLGKPVAYMELNKVFVELLRRFDFVVARPERPMDVVNAGIWLMEDFPVRVTRRDEAA